MRGVNKAIIVGRLGNDPVTRQFGKNETVTTISVVTYEQWINKLTGKKHQKKEWHKISLFGHLSHLASEQLKQGSQVYIEGSIHTRRWFDKNRQIHSRLNIRAHQLRILGVSNSIPELSVKPSSKNDSKNLLNTKLTPPRVNRDDIPF